jgi:hypothetical protein
MLFKSPNRRAGNPLSNAHNFRCGGTPKKRDPLSSVERPLRHLINHLFHLDRANRSGSRNYVVLCVLDVIKHHQNKLSRRISIKTRYLLFSKDQRQLYRWSFIGTGFEEFSAVNCPGNDGMSGRIGLCPRSCAS